MRVLARVLGRSGCLAARRSGGSPGHLESCPGCRARQEQERRYLERLRRAAIPAASDDLTARLLARTEQLAAGLPGPDPSILLPAPPPGRAGVAAFFRHSAARSAGAGDAGTGRTSAGIAWKSTGVPDVTPAGALSAEQLAVLRSQGWVCPELRSLGFHLVRARGAVLAGASVLELRLTDGRHFATVVEQHGPALPAQGTGAEQRPAAPVNVLTGRPATADGFTAARSHGIAGSAVPGDGTVWINAAAPFQAICQASGATFTLVTDLPAERAGNAVAALMQPGAGIPAGPPGPGGVPGRLQRGLHRILRFLAP